jgi:hypothetical protein
MAFTKLKGRWSPPALVLIAAAGVSSAGCGDSSGTGGEGGTSGTMGTTTMSGPTTSPASSGTNTTSSGTGGGGPLALTPVGDATLAFDATPDPAGGTIFFTAIDPTKGAGVFQVSASGTNLTPNEVTAGAPFVAPFGIATSTDGQTLYVADAGGDSGNAFSNGVIYSLSSGGSTPAIVAGSKDVQARGLEILSDNGSDTIFFTGRDVTDNKPGVFKLPAAGGTVSVVAKGAPFIDPSGIALASDGTAYVIDTVASGGHTAQVFKVSTTGTVTPQPVTYPNSTLPITVGFPAGVALSVDGTSIYISGRNPADLTDSLITITGATVTTLANPGFVEGAGLHRAKNVNVFAWADSDGGPAGGRVSVIK